MPTATRQFFQMQGIVNRNYEKRSISLLAGQWSADREKRFQDMLALADNAKRLWPLPRLTGDSDDTYGYSEG